MSEYENNTENPEEEPEVLSHTDKFTGIFTEPGVTFTKMTSEPAKTMDWLLPLVLLLLTIIASSAIILNNPVIRSDVKEKAYEKTEKNLQEMVKNGQLSQMQADEQLAQAEKRLEMIGSPMGILFQSITILIFGFLMFFIVAGIHLGFMKVMFKSAINFKQTLVTNGLVAYISLLTIIVSTMLSILMGKAVQSVSLAAFVDFADGSIGKVLAGKVDPFSIWAYAVLAIGYAKFSKSEQSGKYIGLVLGLWLGWSIVWHYLSQAVPFLRAFAG